MALIRCALLALFLLVPTTRAEIREIHKLSETLPSIQPGTLLVFDLDNTLIEPIGDFGSDQWYYFLVRQYRRDGASEREAHRKAMRRWNKVQDGLRMRAVESETAAFVRQRQMRGVRSMGLTARESSLVTTTLRQLRALGIRLDLHTIFPQTFSWWSNEPARFDAGVLFIGETNDKGTLLIELLRGLRQRPKRIVFIDDKTKNVRSVDLAARKAGIPCIAFRYGATDAKVKRFNERNGIR